jgi:hypothetical protein
VGADERAVAATLDAYVADYIATSRRAIQKLVDEETPESLQAALERVVRRWEEERAVALVNRLLEKGFETPDPDAPVVKPVTSVRLAKQHVRQWTVEQSIAKETVLPPALERYAEKIRRAMR